MILLAALLCNYGRGKCLIDVGTEGLMLALISHGDNPIDLDVHPDFRVLSFTALACLATGVLFGLVPALRSTRVDLTPSLRSPCQNLDFREGRNLGEFGPHSVGKERSDR